jgi:hypothetical protein
MEGATAPFHKSYIFKKKIVVKQKLSWDVIPESVELIKE